MPEIEKAASPKFGEAVGLRSLQVLRRRTRTELDEMPVWINNKDLVGPIWTFFRWFVVGTGGLQMRFPSGNVIHE
jgi:hypothetical protein